MAFPITNYSRVWVRGKLVDLAKAAREVTNYGASGPIQFIPTPTALIDSATKQYIAPTAFSVMPAVTDGSFAVFLPSTNDPDITPSGWNYKVVMPWGQTFHISVPFNTANLNSPGDPLHGQPVIELTSLSPDPDANAGTLQVVAGAAGRGVSSITVNGSNHLIITMTDASTVDAGAVVAGVDAEGVRDTMGTALVAGTGMGVTVNDGSDTITLSTTALLPTLATAKGDLLVATGSGSVTRLAVGSNGQVPMADSSQTSGLRYATVSAPYVTDYPSLHGFVEWNCDPMHASQTQSASNALTSGTITLAKLVAQVTGTVNNITAHVISAGSGLTSGQSFAGIYDSSGNRLGVTASQSTNWAATGIQTMALTSSASITAGQSYYIALLSVGTTPPKFAQGPTTVQAVNAGLSASGLRFATNGTAQTSLPSTRTLASNSGTNAVTFWCALS